MSLTLVVPRPDLRSELDNPSYQVVENTLLCVRDATYAYSVGLYVIVVMYVMFSVFLLLFFLLLSRSYGYTV